MAGAVALGRVHEDLLPVAGDHELDHGVGRHVIQVLEIGLLDAADVELVDEVADAQPHRLGEASRLDLRHLPAAPGLRGEPRPQARERVGAGQPPEPRGLVRRPGHQPSAIGRRGERVDGAVMPGEEPGPSPVVEAVDRDPGLAADRHGGPRMAGPGRQEAVGPPAAIEPRVELDPVSLLLSIQDVQRPGGDGTDGPAVPRGHGPAQFLRAEGGEPTPLQVEILVLRRRLGSVGPSPREADRLDCPG